MLGLEFTAADCVGYAHFTMIGLATTSIYGEDMLARHVPQAAAYMIRMEERPHVQAMMADRAAATAAFIALNMPYDG